MFHYAQDLIQVEKYLEENIKSQEQHFFLTRENFLTIYQIINGLEARSPYATTAITLNPHTLGTTNGWTIAGEIKKDYYSWINEFEAHKNEHKIQGDMESVLTGNSKAALIQFVLENLSFIDIWDYKDI